MYLFGIIVFFILVGAVVAIPYRVFIVKTVIRSGLEVKVSEKIYLTRKRAQKEFLEQRTKVYSEYDSKFHDDLRVNENWSIGKHFPRFSDGEITDRFKVTVPYGDYDTEYTEIIVQLKYLS